MRRCCLSALGGYVFQHIVRVFRCGDDLVIRLRTGLVNALNLQEGDDLTFNVAGTSVRSTEKGSSTKALLISLRRFRGRLRADYKFNRPEANERS